MPLNNSTSTDSPVVSRALAVPRRRRGKSMQHHHDTTVIPYNTVNAIIHRRHQPNLGCTNERTRRSFHPSHPSASENVQPQSLSPLSTLLALPCPIKYETASHIVHRGHTCKVICLGRSRAWDGHSACSVRRWRYSICGSRLHEHHVAGSRINVNRDRDAHREAHRHEAVKSVKTNMGFIRDGGYRPDGIKSYSVLLGRP